MMKKWRQFCQLYNNLHLTECTGTRIGRPMTYQYRCAHNQVWKSDKTLYGKLNLQPGASKQEVKDAYIKLSKEFHPDINMGNSEAHQRFTEINEAYTKILKALESGKGKKFTSGHQDHSGIDYSYSFGNMSESLKYDPIKKKNIRKVKQQSDEYTWRQGVEDLFKSKIFLAILGSLILYKSLSVIQKSGETEANKQMEASYLRQRQKTRIMEKQKKEEEEKRIDEYERKWGLKKSTKS